MAPSREILTRLLTTKIKPAFQASPHPQLNTSTGRKLPRQAGGAMAGQDFYEEQVWKADASAVALVGWCARHMDVSGCSLDVGEESSRRLTKNDL